MEEQGRDEWKEKTVGIYVAIPISTAVIACAIHSILSAAVDIGIAILQQSPHSDVLLIPTGFSYHSSLPCFFTFCCHVLYM